jgi:hypothetical protein
VRRVSEKSVETSERRACFEGKSQNIDCRMVGQEGTRRESEGGQEMPEEAEDRAASPAFAQFRFVYIARLFCRGGVNAHGGLVEAWEGSANTLRVCSFCGGEGKSVRLLDLRRSIHSRFPQRSGVPSFGRIEAGKRTRGKQEDQFAGHAMISPACLLWIRECYGLNPYSDPFLPLEVRLFQWLSVYFLPPFLWTHLVESVLSILVVCFFEFHR